MPKTTIVQLDQYRTLAYAWHGGQWSDLYSFASTGSVASSLDIEIDRCINMAIVSGVTDDLDELRAFYDDVRTVERLWNEANPDAEALPDYFPGYGACDND